MIGHDAANVGEQTPIGLGILVELKVPGQGFLIEVEPVGDLQRLVGWHDGRGNFDLEGQVGELGTAGGELESA